MLPLGYLNYGFETAAQRYFGKSIYQLSDAQQLALITLMKNPVRYDPFKHPDLFYARYKALISSLHQEKYISSNKAQTLMEDQYTLDWEKEHIVAQPYFRDYIQTTHAKKSSLPPEIITTIDDHLSRTIKNIADQTIYSLLRKDVSDYGVLIIDKQTNELRVMLGGIDYQSKEGQVNATLSINQP